MSTIDISLGFRHISPTELRNYTNLGLISCAGVDLSEFLEKLLEGMYSQEELDQQLKDAEKDYDCEHCDSGDMSPEHEHLYEQVERAIKILQEGLEAI